MQDIDKPLNDKQWQDSSDGWVKTMNESKERKENNKLDYCKHDDFEWCELCHFDEQGEQLTLDFDNIEPEDYFDSHFEEDSRRLYGDNMPDADVFNKHINKIQKQGFDQFCQRMWLDNCDENKHFGATTYTLLEYTTNFNEYLKEKFNDTTEK